jgi:hypothetical protein
MASAEAITFSRSMFLAQEFHPFHPIGGVSAMVSPMIIFSSFVASPKAFLAVKVLK